MKRTEAQEFADIVCEGLRAADIERLEDIAEAGWTRPFNWEDVEHEHLEDEDE